MQTYLTRIVILAILLSIVTALAGKGKSQRQIAFVASLIMTGVSLSPLIGVLPESFTHIFDFTPPSIDSGEGYTDGEVKQVIEHGLRLQIADEFSLDSEEITVSAKINISDSIIIERVNIDLTGSAIGANSPAIVSYIEKNTGAECSVTLNGK